MLMLNRRKEEAFYCNEMIVIIKEVHEQFAVFVTHLAGKTKMIRLQTGCRKEISVNDSEFLLTFWGLNYFKNQGKFGITASRDVNIVREELIKIGASPLSKGSSSTDFES